MAAGAKVAEAKVAGAQDAGAQPDGSRTIVVAPDSFKGSAAATTVAAALADGWTRVRPSDRLRIVPLADGGEGTLDTVRDATAGSREFASTVTGPDGRPQRATWLLLPDGTALVELAAASGLTQMRTPDAGAAQTAGFGELLREAAAHPGTQRIVATLGGSAATDGGSGALRALGARFLDDAGRELAPGGVALAELARVELGQLVPPPSGGVAVLTDVESPLFGTHGAAAVFGPQKGADRDLVDVLDSALRRLAAVLGGDPDRPGAGAAGGAGYGLAAAWSAVLRPGAPAVAEIVALPEALRGADLVITGEGRFDEQSLRGKVVGHVLSVAPCPVALAAGATATDEGTVAALQRFAAVATLTEPAGSTEAAVSDPVRWATVAGEALARSVFGPGPAATT
ncbi:MAG: glycerate kinase [Williamsia herbipolensis]|nr:glycerate kinase [Williamsia herbipolensis]